MNTVERSYSIQIGLRASTQKVFDALSSKIGDWWGDQDKPALQSGDVFTVSWGEPWYQFKVVEFEPNYRITWECINSEQIIGDLAGVEKEWVGTQLRWKINQINPGVLELLFVHAGLVPDFVCYDFCSNTWDRFIRIDLKRYLENPEN